MNITYSTFSNGEIWAYPTDTSFGLGVRTDDVSTLEILQKLKKRSGHKYFSLMVKDFEMLNNFAEVPHNLNESFFWEKPKTVILKPKKNLPPSIYWPEDKVAFRVSTILEVSQQISYPITATSANISGENPIFEAQKIREIFGDEVKLFPGFEKLPENPPSEIWDLTGTEVRRLR